MSAKDKQRLGIAIGLVVVVAAALYFFVFRPRTAADDRVALGPGQAAAPRTPAGDLADEDDEDRGMVLRLPPGTVPPSAPAPSPAAPGPVAPAAPAGPPAPPAEPAAYRPDPFAPLRVPPPPRPDRPADRPVVLALEEVGPPPVVATLTRVMIRPRQEQRVAGVLWNDRVWAIIETPRTTAVVQPGDQVEGSTVRAISPQGLILMSEEGRQSEVRLQARVSAQAAAAAPVGAPAGRPSPPALPTGPAAY